MSSHRWRKLRINDGDKTTQVSYGCLIGNVWATVTYFRNEFLPEQWWVQSEVEWRCGFNEQMAAHVEASNVHMEFVDPENRGEMEQAIESGREWCRDESKKLCGYLQRAAEIRLRELPTPQKDTP